MVDPDSFLFELELAREYMLYRLEPNISAQEGENIAQLSLAISLRRIADALATTPARERLEADEVTMLRAYHEKVKDKSNAIWWPTMRAVMRFFSGLRP